MPISNSPTTRKLFTRGSVPAGVTVPCGVRERMPVGDAAGEAAYLDVRRNGQDARAQLLLEAVHHRQYDDQCGDTQGDAQHRYRGDERHEAVAARAAARAGVAQSDE